MGVTVETKRRPPMQPIAREPANKPRPVGISSYPYNGRTTEIVYDDGTVWRYVDAHPFEWTRLPPIPQGDA